MIAVGLARIAGMTTTTTPNRSTTNKAKTNGTNPEETSEQTAAAPSPTPTTAPETKPGTRAITVVLPGGLAKQLRVVCSLGDTNISETIAGLVQAHVKQKLPGLLAGLDAEG